MFGIYKDAGLFLYFQEVSYAILYFQAVSYAIIPTIPGK